MRVLILSPELWPVYGGIGNYVVQLSKHMPADVEIRIITPASPEVVAKPQDVLQMLKAILPPSVEVNFLGKTDGSTFRSLAFEWMCRDYSMNRARKDHFDIVHSASTLPDFLVSPRNLGIPLISTVHTTVEGHWRSLRTMKSRFRDLGPSEKATLLFGPILTIGENRYYTNTRHYITVSEWAKKMMVEEKHIDSNRVRVVNIGVDASTFNPSKKNEAKKVYPGLFDEKCPKVLYLSRMATRKGIGLMLRAMPRILQKNDVHFIFAGAGRRPDFRIPRQNYTYLGIVPHDHPPLLYSLSDVFVLPSLYENFPACILEAMASGCAVVTTRICGIPEMVRHEENGLMITPNNAEELVKAVTTLVENDGLRQRISREARTDAMQRFSWEKTAQATRDFYEDVLDYPKRFGSS